jgi:hypothetical protein
MLTLYSSCYDRSYNPVTFCCFPLTIFNFVLAGSFQHRVCHAHDSTRPERNQGNRLPGTFQGQYGSIRLICVIKNCCSLLCQVYCEGIAGSSDGGPVVAAGRHDMCSQACFSYVSAGTWRECWQACSGCCSQHSC